MYKMSQLTKEKYEAQLVAATDRINELEAALFSGGTKKLDITGAILLNNVVHMVIGTTPKGEEVVGVYLHEEDAIVNASLAREVYDEVRTDSWLVQGKPTRGDALAGRAIIYATGQKVSFHDKIADITGTGTVLSADYEYQKSPEEILYKIVPEGFPFSEQYAKILLGSEIRGFVK